MKRTKKEKMITRTFKITLASVMRVNTITAEVETVDVNLVGSFKGNELLEAIKKENESDTLKYVAVMSSYVTEKLMGIPENDFYRMATELPPRANTPDEIE